MNEKNLDHAFWPTWPDPWHASLQNPTHAGADVSKPASAASSNDSMYSISMELPGVSDEDIDLSISNGSLIVRGEMKIETETQGDTWYFSERQYGAFTRTFQLPEDTDGTQVSASMKDGVLTIQIPRSGLDDPDITQTISFYKA